MYFNMKSEAPVDLRSWKNAKRTDPPDVLECLSQIQCHTLLRASLSNVLCCCTKCVIVRFTWFLLLFSLKEGMLREPFRPLMFLKWKILPPFPTLKQLTKLIFMFLMFTVVFLLDFSLSVNH